MYKPNPSKRYCAVHRKWQQVYATGKTIEEVVQKLEKDNESLDDFIICKYQDEKIYMYKVHKETNKNGEHWR